jgi:rsbT co-antagonist protein RsbR
MAEADPMPDPPGGRGRAESGGAWLALGVLNEAFLRLVALQDLGSFWREVCGSARWIVQARRSCVVLAAEGAPEVAAMSDGGASADRTPAPSVAAGSWLAVALQEQRASWISGPWGEAPAGDDLGAWLLEVEPELVLHAPLLASRRTIGALFFAVKAASDADREMMLACGASFGMYVGATFSALKSRTELAEATARLQRQNEELEQGEIELRRQLDIIRVQHAEMTRLSTPIIQVGEGVLALPVIGVVDSDRVQRMMVEVLDAVAGRLARWMILDLTGAQMPDATSAANLLQIVRAVELLGGRCVVSGIPPEVAQCLVEIGADLGAVPAFRTLQQALGHVRRVRAAG